MAYPFTDGRVVANLGPTSFRRQEISGDNVQVGSVETQSTSPRSAYLGSLDHLGELGPEHLQGAEARPGIFTTPTWRARRRSRRAALPARRA